MIVIIMGAAGAGKTTVGRALAEALGWPGLALTDEDRAPWLARTHDVILRASREDADVVLACSALREDYRATLAGGIADVRWVFLDADAELLAARLGNRPGHFAGPAIVSSQLETLERPRDALTLRAGLPVATLVEAIRTHLGR